MSDQPTVIFAGPAAPAPAAPSAPAAPVPFGTALWRTLDGNKALIGALLYIVPDVAQEVGSTLVQLGVPADKVTKATGAVVLLGGLVHKIVKMVRAAQVAQAE